MPLLTNLSPSLVAICHSLNQLSFGIFVSEVSLNSPICPQLTEDHPGLEFKDSPPSAGTKYLCPH